MVSFRKHKVIYIQFLFTQLEDIKEELRRANATIAENASEQKRLNALVLSLTNQLHDALQANKELSLKLEDKESASRVSKKHRFGSSSQKGIAKKDEVKGRDDDKDDFDAEQFTIRATTNGTVKPYRKRYTHRLEGKGHYMYNGIILFETAINMALKGIFSPHLR